jgi:medium-chain acyl-[acyl-carrier-protein] hydrolase
LLKEFNELFYEDLQDAVNDIFDIIDNEIDDSPYAIYGHSMGSLLAFELHPLTFTWI